MKPKVFNLLIPSEILYNEQYNSDEKIILSKIIEFTRNKKYCFVTNKIFAKITGRSTKTVSKIINHLISKEVISVTEKSFKRCLYLNENQLLNINAANAPPIIKDEKSSTHQENVYFKF